MRTLLLLAALASLLSPGRSASRAAEGEWIDLFPAGEPFKHWQGNHDEWIEVGDVRLDPANPRRLAPVEGKGSYLNGTKGRARNLVTREKYTDLEAEVSFCVPRGSNAGVKMMGLYEIQIFDSHGVKEKDLTGSHCGGVYPRGENRPRYHTIDKGVPPRVNAARPAGEWQTLHMVFQGPRFDREGKKVANARFLKVVLNGQVIHENVELLYPTGAAWRLAKEVPAGPFLLQADHGPVAFRKVRIRPLDLKPSATPR